MSKLPKRYLITRPRLKSVVMCYSRPDRPYRAVVTGLPADSVESVEVTRLDDRTVEVVPYSLLTHSRV